MSTRWRPISLVSDEHCFRGFPRPILFSRKVPSVCVCACMCLCVCVYGRPEYRIGNILAGKQYRIMDWSYARPIYIFFFSVPRHIASSPDNRIEHDGLNSTTFRTRDGPGQRGRFPYGRPARVPDGNRPRQRRILIRKRPSDKKITSFSRTPIGKSSKTNKPSVSRVTLGRCHYAYEYRHCSDETHYCIMRRQKSNFTQNV